MPFSSYEKERERGEREIRIQNRGMKFFFYRYSHILDTPVTEREFLEQLHELNHKINFVKEQSFRDARACHDVKDILEKLKIKVPCVH